MLDTLDHGLGDRARAANIPGVSIRTLRDKLNEPSSEVVEPAKARDGEAARLCWASNRDDRTTLARRRLCPMMP
jgi:hypothetical protein